MSLCNQQTQRFIFQEILQLPGVGERLAKKVLEIIETGHLQRLDHIDPRVEKLNLFSGVWGAGPKTAEEWVARVSLQFFLILKALLAKYTVVNVQLCHHDVQIM